MLPRGPKRGGIREKVGFEERKAERGKMGGGLGDGARPLQCVIANQ